MPRRPVPAAPTPRLLCPPLVMPWPTRDPARRPPPTDLAAGHLTTSRAEVASGRVSDDLPGARDRWWLHWGEPQGTDGLGRSALSAQYHRDHTLLQVSWPIARPFRVRPVAGGRVVQVTGLGTVVCAATGREGGAEGPDVACPDLHLQVFPLDSPLAFCDPSIEWVPASDPLYALVHQGILDWGRRLAATPSWALWRLGRTLDALDTLSACAADAATGNPCTLWWEVAAQVDPALAADDREVQLTDLPPLRERLRAQLHLELSALGRAASRVPSGPGRHGPELADVCDLPVSGASAPPPALDSLVAWRGGIALALRHVPHRAQRLRLLALSAEDRSIEPGGHRRGGPPSGGAGTRAALFAHG